MDANYKGRRGANQTDEAPSGFLGPKTRPYTLQEMRQMALREFCWNAVYLATDVKAFELHLCLLCLPWEGLTPPKPFHHWQGGRLQRRRQLELSQQHPPLLLPSD